MRFLRTVTTLALCSFLPLHYVSAQQHATPATAPDTATAPAQDQNSGPVVHVMAFGDATYVGTDRKISSGFLLGQAVGHLVAALTDRLTYFGEVTATAQSSGYDGARDRCTHAHGLRNSLRPIAHLHTARPVS